MAVEPAYSAKRTRVQKNSNMLASPTSLIARWLLAGVISFVFIVQASAADPAPFRIVGHVPGRILVQPKGGVSDADLDGAVRVHRGHRTHNMRASNVHVVALPAGSDERAVLRALRRNPRIKFAEFDEVVELAAMTNDPLASTSWHLAKINAPSAWDRAAGTGVVVAVLDTGVDAAHPDLATRLVAGWNLYDNNADTRDVHGHGTKTAGAVGEAANNAMGSAGVSWDAQVMPIRIGSPTGTSTFSLIAAGITWAADHGARVASVSFRGLGGSATVLSAAQYMRSKGGVVIVAAGNEGALQSTPPNSFLTTVAATASTDARASFSNYGPFIDVAAPGVSIRTTVRGGAYGTASGTSFSTPIVAGVYALMMSVNRTLSPVQLDSMLFASAVDLGAGGFDNYFGYGRVDAAAAVAAAVQAGGASDTSSPNASISAPANGATVSAVTSVNIAASDNVGVAKVELYVGGVLLATDSTAPYAFAWNTASVPDGATTLQAKAYDAAGNYRLSSMVSVTVANATSGDAVAPKVTILKPFKGAKAYGTIPVSATSTDNVATTSMELLIDGVSTTVVDSASLLYRWTVPASGTGTTPANVTVRAWDAAGNMGSTTITVYR